VGHGNDPLILKVKGAERKRVKDLGMDVTKGNNYSDDQELL
jgi:hypothetical protein